MAALSEDTCGCSQLLRTQVHCDLTPSSGLHGHCSTQCTDIHEGKTPINIKIINKIYLGGNNDV